MAKRSYVPDSGNNSSKSNNDDRKPMSYSRRAFLKKSGRIGAVAAVYATVGNVAGRGYRAARDFVRKYTPIVGNKLTEIDDKTDSLPSYDPRNAVKKVEDWRTNFWQKVIGRTDEDQAKWRKDKGIKDPKSYKPDTSSKDSSTQDEKMDRRGFFRNLLSFAHENPVGTGTVVGGGYGAGKSYVKHRATDGVRKEVARLRDEVHDLRSGLDEKVQEAGEMQNDGTEYLAIGLATLLILVIFNAANLTGFSIASSYSVGSPINIIIFLISLALIFIGSKNLYTKKTSNEHENKRV